MKKGGEKTKEGRGKKGIAKEPGEVSERGALEWSVKGLGERKLAQ